MKKINWKKILKVFLIVLLIVLGCFLVTKLVNSDTKKEVTFTKSIKKRATELGEEYDTVDYVDVSKLKKSDITEGGSYSLSGDYECITINSSSEVNLLLDNANIVCETGPGINIVNAKEVNIMLKGENSIKSNTSIDYGGAIYSLEDLILSGDGSLKIDSNFDGIVSKDNLIIKSGSYYITSQGDGIKGKDVVAIVDGNFVIDAKEDGIKSTNIDSKAKGYITIDNGTFDIKSSLDGIQAETEILISNGSFKINAGNNSSNDSSKGIKTNDLIEISGGEFNINSEDDGINTGKSMIIDNGNFNIISNDEGIKSITSLINNGVISINSVDGIKSTYFKMNDGTININAKDDGIAIINEDKKYNPAFELNGGVISIEMGAGSSSGISSVGSFTMHNGTIKVKGDLPFSFTGEVIIDGGEVYKNGRQIEDLSSLVPRRKGSNNNKDHQNNGESSQKKDQ